MKYNKKTALFLIVGIAPLWLSACSKSDDTARGEAGAISVSIESDVTPQSRPEVVMYKSPDCECCTGWAEHLRKAGFTVSIHKQDDMDAIKEKFGVSEQLSSCHTAIIDGFVIEGHVPAADIDRLLKERPDIVGLTAPGMPMKSPGMQEVGQKPEGYSVLAFDKAGNTSLFHRY